MMKKKFAMALVAAVAVAVLAVSFAACGGTGDVKGLYETLVELQAKEEGTTTVSAVELDHLSGAEVSVSGDALLAEIEDPDTYDIVYELWVGGTKRVYRGEERPALIADWCWYVYDGQEDTVTVYTVNENVSDEFVYDGSAPYVEGDTLYVNDEAFCEYDAKTETVTVLDGSEAGGNVPTLNPKGDRYELEEVDIEILEYDDEDMPEAVRVYDKNGDPIRLVNLSALVPGATGFLMTKKAVYLSIGKMLPSEAQDYDFYTGSTKVKYAQYKYDWKSGELSEFDPGYLFFGKNAVPDADVFSVAKMEIEDNKVEVTQRIVYCDADMKVLYDLGEMLQGAYEAVVFGDYIKIAGSSIVRYYDSEGNLVGEYGKSGAPGDIGGETNKITEDESGLLKKGNDWFTVSGEYLFTLGSDGASRMASVPGRLYYTEARVDRDGEPELDETGAPIVDFKVYDVAAGKHTTICSSDEEYASFFANYGVYIVVDKDGAATVYDMSDGSELIDFETNDPTSVDFRNFGDDLLIEYTVTHRQGSVETDEMRYILIDVERQFN